MNDGPLAYICSFIIKLDSVIYPTMIVPLVAFLPALLAYGVAVVHGDLRHKLDKPLREEIAHNLRVVLNNQLSTEESTRITRDCFRVRSCETMDAMRLAGGGMALVRLVEFHGLEHINAALAKGRGAVLCSAHFGSSKCCFPVLGAVGYPITLVARWSYSEDPNKSPILRFIYRLTHNMPVTSHSRRPNIQRRPRNFGVAVQAASLVRKNELVGIHIDSSIHQKDPARPVLVPFLNRQVLLATGAVTIAKFTGAPLLVMFMRRSTDWRHQIMEILPPISVEGETTIAFKRCLAVVEDAVQRYPSHWKWTSRRMVRLGLLAKQGTKSQLSTDDAFGSDKF